MNDRISDIAGALTGIVFVVLFFIGFGISGDARKDLDDFNTLPSAAEAASVLEDRRDQVITGSPIVLFGVAFFFGFLAYFRSRLQQAESEGGWLTLMAYGGGLVTAVVLLGWISLDLAMTAGRDYGPDTQVAKTLIALQWRYIWMFAPPMMAFTLGASLVIVRYAALPRWVGWIGFPVAVTLLAPWIGAAVVMAWILVVSIVLLIQAWRAPQPREAN